MCLQSTHKIKYVILYSIAQAADKLLKDLFCELVEVVIMFSLLMLLTIIRAVTAITGSKQTAQTTV